MLLMLLLLLLRSLQGTGWLLLAMASVSNGSNPLERFRVRVGTETEPLQRALPHENPDRCKWAGFTTKNPASEHHNFGSN